MTATQYGLGQEQRKLRVVQSFRTVCGQEYDYLQKIESKGYFLRFTVYSRSRINSVNDMQIFEIISEYTQITQKNGDILYILCGYVIMIDKQYQQVSSKVQI